MHQIRKITIKILKYFELDHNENTTDQNFVDAVEALLKGKFMALTCTFKKKKPKKQLAEHPPQDVGSSSGGSKHKYSLTIPAGSSSMKILCLFIFLLSSYLEFYNYCWRFHLAFQALSPESSLMMVFWGFCSMEILGMIQMIQLNSWSWGSGFVPGSRSMAFFLSFFSQSRKFSSPPSPSPFPKPASNSECEANPLCYGLNVCVPLPKSYVEAQPPLWLT